ncbi:aspartyl/glutamyl-tRNA(Asn/Gln) amidotransferase subunit A [Antricoccus suffuscus]|uniref:Glutamyl-tRNA(Gln) amidotransferase subunit A n=1 Tax=Antricoccus suffuscus TaxID=1629062 RepID=A0A2T1A4I1_9ACTN|nr:Asp-tRNA(Asn)/Glu-tRNA(Gln) amidotransferase subunit GatA [Antricoccus suffuscus]PRZ43454.1 aspartyl/glutamyl-tRNA(Asn/Gln) amidotransferase subunit A [Antricoccus suffuscus]
MAPSELIHLSAADLAARLAAGDVTSVEVTQAHLDQISAVDDTIGSFLHVDGAKALAQAATVDEDRAAGKALGPLAGVPIGLKDVFVTRGTPTTAGSKILEGWTPPYESTVSARALAAGLVVLGKTNMDEFAMGSTNENSAYKPVRNPWNHDRIPGGSSGGSASAVASFETPLSLGTDTGGSVRQPAAMCGLVGMKPTYGSNSRYGVIAFSSSLDTPGPFGRTVMDTALLHEAISGYDPCDSTSIDAPVPGVVAAARKGANGDLTGVRVGVVRELGGDGYETGVMSAFEAGVQTLRDLGATVTEVSCPHFSYSLPAYYLIAPSEASSNLARFDSVRYGLRVGDDGEASLEEVMSMTREAGFGAEVKRRIILGAYALSSGYYDAYYGQAQKVRTLLARDFTAAFEQVDVLVSPTTPTVAYPIGAKVNDPLAMYQGDLCTLPASLVGVPAMSLPVGLAEDPADSGGTPLPVGLQIMAPTMADDRCYRVGAALEGALDASRGAPFLAELAIR